MDFLPTILFLTLVVGVDVSDESADNLLDAIVGPEKPLAADLASTLGTLLLT